MQADKIVAGSVRAIGVFAIAAGLVLNPAVIERFLTPDGKIGSTSTSFAIIAFDLILICAGAYCLVRARPLAVSIIKRRRELALSLIVFLVSIVVLDQAMRFVLPPTYSADQSVWTREPGSVVKKLVEDSPGQFRQITSTIEENGFKRWGDTKTARQKVLIIGDSFTEMTYVMNGEEWYAYLEKAFPNAEFFVFGAGGYGTLQEYLVLDRYIDEIKPDFIVWQFCENDYGDNLFEYDLARYPHNNYSYRPYLENGEIVYRLPLPLARMRNVSRVADYVLRIYDKYMKLRAYGKGVPAPEISPDIETRAAEVTQTILSMVKDRVGSREIFLFSVNELGQKEMDLCNESGFQCIAGVNAHLQAAVDDGQTVAVINDGHWNTVGNRLAGEFLADYLGSKKLP